MSTRIRNGFTTTGNSRITGSLTVTAGITGSLSGSASTSISASYALTASYVAGGGSGTVFPYTGSAIISGSLTVTGSIYTNSPIYSPFVIGLNFETNTPYTFNAPYSFYISSSESNPSGSITIKYQASGSATTSSYVYGNTINKFDSLIITPPSISLVILNSVKI